jgi:WD40 repeat protein
MLTLNPLNGPVTALAYAPDGRTLAAGHDAGAVSLLAPDGGDGLTVRAPPESPDDPPERVLAVTFAPVSRSLATLSAGEVLDPHESSFRETVGRVRCFELPSGRVRFSVEGYRFTSTTQLVPAGLRTAALTPEQAKAATRAATARALAWTPALCFSPDGRTILSGRHLKLGAWDASRGAPAGVPRLELDHFTAAVLADGRLRAAGFRGGLPLLVEATGFQVEHLPTDDTTLLTLFALAPDGRTLAQQAQSRREIELWEVRPRRLIAFLPGPDEPLLRAVFSPDATLFGTAALDHRVQVWETATGRPRGGYNWKVGDVSALAFAPDGLTAAVGGNDGVIAVWDVEG